MTVTGVLKISNLDSADYFGDQSENKRKRKARRWLSSEYLAPEAFVETDFDPKACDMWAAGVVYLEMRTGTTYWGLAAEGADERYDRYLMEKSGMWGFRPIENLNDVSMLVIRG